MRSQKDQQYCFSTYNGKLEANWKVLLNDGRIFYQDDGSTWLDLKNLCQKENVWPIHLMLEFYDNTINILPPNAEGYFFRRGFLAEMNSGLRSKTGVIGYYENKELHTWTFKYPELLIWDSQTRNEEKIKSDNIYNDNSLILVKECQKCQPMIVNIPTERLQQPNI